MSRRKKITQKEVSEGLRRLAFGEIKDAVTLLYESEENILRLLPELDLYNVSKIKRPKGGGMEIKFFDRMKALDKLGELAARDNSRIKTSFFDALEKGAASVGDIYDRGSGDCDE